MYIASRYAYLLVSVTCSGCMTAAALVSSPQVLDLTPEPARNYELSLDIQVDEKTHHIDYSWKCEQVKVFTASVMKWVLKWRTESRLVAKQFPDNLVVYFWEPSAGFCYSESSNYVPSIVVTDGNGSPGSLIFYDTKLDYKTNKPISSVVKQGTLWRVNQPSTLDTMSPQEESLAAALRRRVSSSDLQYRFYKQE